ncbi:MAG TPA: tetratricopeptide repeat protein [Polyangiaceae bacterium]
MPAPIRPSNAPPAPAPKRTRVEPQEIRDEQRVPLRLTVTRGVLGMELYEPIELGPIEVSRLGLSLPNLKFPLDLSGGVPRFRHRRGELEHLELRSSLSGLGVYLERRLRALIGDLVRPVSVFAKRDSLSVGLVSADAAFAFDLLWAPDGRHARFVISDARGVGLAGPPLAFALRALDSAVSGFGTRRGRLLTVEDAGSLIGRRVLPAIGARAPAAANVRFGELAVSGDELKLEVDATFAPLAASADATRALELAGLTLDADEALARGDLDAARAGYLQALERAPRHPELVRLIVGIDSASNERAEAAQAMLVESMPVTRSGLAGAELSWQLRDDEAARQAIAEATQREVFAPLAAMLWCRLAERDPSPLERLAALDRAVGLAPGLEAPRHRRFHARLARSDVEGALGDAEHLEAMARGARAKHAINLETARAFMSAGFVSEARRTFERALRYAPDDPNATAGLARALVQAGRRDRAASLLARAITLSERKGKSDAHALIDLALLLANDLKDLPQAIARVRQVPASSERLVEARFLEARWRANLGDIAGASLAFGRMREAIELSSTPPPGAGDYLREAAAFERTTERDPFAAERHLAVAIRIAPRDGELADLYRAVAAEVAEATRLRRERRL